jgi:hypothetical protein
MLVRSFPAFASSVALFAASQLSIAFAQQPPATSPAAQSPAPQLAEMPPQPPVAPQLTEVLFKNLKARAIGPAVMGGRVSEIALDPRNPALFYAGMATGGVFKTADNGITFEPIFDKESTLSIGAITIAPSDSDILWVGTGEASDRNSAGWGNGVYRSTDGGSTWQNVGLKESRAIGRIACIRRIRTSPTSQRPDICGSMAASVDCSRPPTPAKHGNRSCRPRARTARAPVALT